MQYDAIQGVCKMAVQVELGEQVWSEVGARYWNAGSTFQVEKKRGYWGEVAWS
jgi:hypothetical protein